jgi:hypothetical protein
LTTVAQDGVVGSPTGVATEEILQNDTWDPGESLTIISGLVSGDMVASRLTPSGPGSVQIKMVSLLFGGATTTEEVILRIWEDNAGTAAPGTQVFSDTYQLTGSSIAMQEIDLEDENIVVTGTFRVGFEYTHSGGVPSVLLDNDGQIPTRNFIFSGSWMYLESFFTSEDFVIRATVEPTNYYVHLPLVLANY